MAVVAPRFPWFSLPAWRRPKPLAASAARVSGPRSRLLAAEWALAFHKDGQCRTYRLRQQWDGRQGLEPGELPPGRPWVAVLDAGLPLRRKLQRFPATAAARQALLKAAADEFPLSGEVRYAVGRRGPEGYLFALPEDEFRRLAEGRAAPASILVAPGSPDPDACLDALGDHARYGPAVDFLHRRAGLSRRHLRNGILSVVLVILMAGAGGLAFGPDLLGSVAGWQARRLRDEAGDLPRIHAATEAMAAAQAASARLAAMPEARAAALLARLMNTVPPGHSIRRIELGGGVLRIAGSGTDVQAWLATEGFPAEAIVTEKTGNFTAWRAELKL